MTFTKIRGSSQIQAGTILDAQIAANAAIATSKLLDGANFIKRDGSVAMVGNLDLGSNKIINVAAPVNAGDVANKSYVDIEVSTEAAARIAGDAQLSSDISAETAARFAAISAEEAARAAADAAIETSLETEVLRAEAAELALGGRLDTIEAVNLPEINGRLDVVESNTDQNTIDIANEVARATAAEGVLASDLAAEVTRATGAESNLALAISAEQTRAEGAEAGLAADIAAEETRAMAAESALATDLAAEVTRATAAEGQLSADLAAEVLDRQAGDASTLTSAQTYTDQKVADLVNSAPAVLDTLKELSTALGDDPNFATTIAGQIGDVAADLSAEVTRATAAEAAIASDLAAEIARATAAEGQLSSDLSAESAARAAADTTLQSNINAEASARAAADTALDGRLVKAEENLAFPVDPLFENNASVYADARPGVIDPSSLLRDGWYFQNGTAGHKINWYFYDGNANNITVADFSMYAVVTVDSLTSLPFLVAYTVGTDNGWFKSSKLFYMPSAGTVVGKKYLIYVGQNPNVHTDIPHVQCTPGTVKGAFASTERILTASFSTNSGAAVDNVKLIVDRLGVNAPTFKQEYELRIRHASQASLDTEIAARIAGDNALTSSLSSETAARQAADTALTNSLNTEISDRQAADSSLQAQIDALESSSGADLSALEARVTTAEADIDTLESGLAQEILDRQAGDSSTLASAQSYADQKVADLVNSAPGVLDTLKELASALGDDPNFATTVASQVAAVQAEVDAEELARAAADTTLQANIDSEAATRLAADNALDARLDILELYKDAQTVYVAKNGNDSTGNGGEHAPFLTLQGAMASITDSAPSKRYIIKVKSGSYTESGVLGLKPNVFVVGESKDAVRISASSFAMDATFNAPSSSDNRSGFANATLLSACDFNWQTVSSPAGKLYFNEVQFGAAVSLYGHNNAIAQAQFHGCLFFGAFTVSGINVGVHKNNIHYGNITLNQHPNGGMATILAADGGVCSGTVTLNATTNDFNRRCSVFARSFYMEYLTVNGPSAYCDLTDNSVPRDIARVTKSNGGNIVYINTLAPIDTNSRNHGEVGRQYLYNFNYVNASTGTDLYVISMGTAYSADNAGKSIFIEADSYGLTSNVNGGDINLTTAETTGTGVRGKIKVSAREMDLSNIKLVNLADGTDAKDAVNKSQLDAEASARAAADSSLQAQIDALESSSGADLSALEARVTTAEGDINTLESGLAQEILDRQAGDSATLASAQSYADQKVADLVNSAPAVLDTLKELSDALGGDANFAATVAGQIGDVAADLSAEEAARIAADSALDSRLTTAEGDISALEASVAGLESSKVSIANVVSRETPAGDVDGVNAAFTLANTPVAGSEHVYLNGLLLEPGVGNDYTISSAVITFDSAPASGDKVRVSYLK